MPVYLSVMPPALGQVSFVVDRQHRACFDTDAAIDAGTWTDIELFCRNEYGIRRLWMNGIESTNLNARKIVETRRGDHISHDIMILNTSGTRSMSNKIEYNQEH